MTVDLIEPDVKSFCKICYVSDSSVASLTKIKQTRATCVSTKVEEANRTAAAFDRSCYETEVFDFLKIENSATPKFLVLNQNIVSEKIDWQFPLVLKTAMDHVRLYENYEIIDAIIVRLEVGAKLSKTNLNFLKDEILQEYFENSPAELKRQKPIVFHFVRYSSGGEVANGINFSEELQSLCFRDGELVLLNLDENGNRATKVSENDVAKAFEELDKSEGLLMRFLLPTVLTMDSTDERGVVLRQKKNLCYGDIVENICGALEQSTFEAHRERRFLNLWLDFCYAFVYVSVCYVDWIRSTLMYYAVTIWLERFLMRFFKTHGGNTYRHQPTVITAMKIIDPTVLNRDCAKVFLSHKFGYLNQRSYVRYFYQDEKNKIYFRSKKAVKDSIKNMDLSLLTVFVMLVTVVISFQFFVKSHFAIKMITDFGAFTKSFHTSNDFAWWFYFLRNTVGNVAIFFSFRIILLRFYKLTAANDSCDGKQKGCAKVFFEESSEIEPSIFYKTFVLTALQPFMLTFGLTFVIVFKFIFCIESALGQSIISQLFDRNFETKDKMILDRNRELAKRHVKKILT